MGAKPSIPMVRLPRDMVVIVTGGNTGIGYETVKFIAMMGAEVILACRSEERANAAIARMNEEFVNEKEHHTENIIEDDQLNIHFMQLDLASLSSTKKFIDTFLATGKKLHVLICNAGIYMAKEVLTQDNFEETFQVNYLCQFLIAASLIPVMKKSGDDARIILVSSRAHMRAKYDAEYASGKVMSKKEFDSSDCYNKTKLFQIMQMYSFDRLLLKCHVEVSCVHPGYVETDLFRRNDKIPKTLKCRTCCMKCTGSMKTPHEGAKTTIYAAVNPELKGMSRAYWDHARAAPVFPSKEARNRCNQDHLLRSTVELLKDYLPDEFMTEALDSLEYFKPDTEEG